MNSALERGWKHSVAIFIIAALVVVVAGCEEPSVSISARIRDFLDDVRSGSHDRVRSHFHSETVTTTDATDELWPYFRPDEADDYNWNESSRTESSRYQGSTRVIGTIDILGVEPDDEPDKPIIFFMKVEDGDWMIRAIYDSHDEDKGALIESWQQRPHLPDSERPIE